MCFYLFTLTATPFQSLHFTSHVVISAHPQPGRIPGASSPELSHYLLCYLSTTGLNTLAVHADHFDMFYFLLHAFVHTFPPKSLPTLQALPHM